MAGCCINADLHSCVFALVGEPNNCGMLTMLNKGESRLLTHTPVCGSLLRLKASSNATGWMQLDATHE